MSSSKWTWSISSYFLTSCTFSILNLLYRTMTPETFGVRQSAIRYWLQWFWGSFVTQATWKNLIDLTFNICSIELKWDGKKLKHDMITRWDNTNNGVQWMRSIVPKKVEQINDPLFIDTYKSNNIKIDVYDMTVNDSEMCVIWRRRS